MAVTQFASAFKQKKKKNICSYSDLHAAFARWRTTCGSVPPLGVKYVRVNHWTGVGGKLGLVPCIIKLSLAPNLWMELYKKCSVAMVG